MPGNDGFDRIHGQQGLIRREEFVRLLSVVLVVKTGQCVAAIGRREGLEFDDHGGDTAGGIDQAIDVQRIRQNAGFQFAEFCGRAGQRAEQVIDNQDVTFAASVASVDH